MRIEDLQKSGEENPDEEGDNPDEEGDNEEAPEEYEEEYEEEPEGKYDEEPEGEYEEEPEGKYDEEPAIPINDKLVHTLNALSLQMRLMENKEKQKDGVSRKT